MKKILLSIAFIGVFLTGYTQNIFPFDIKIAGDLTVDSVFMLTTTPAVSTSDTFLVLDAGVVKYQTRLTSDSSMWSIDTDTTYSKNSGAVRITAGDLYPSVDGTYDLGTPTYGWDTLFLSSVIEYDSDLVFSSGGDKMKLTTGGKLGVGVSHSPDSLFDVKGGAKIKTDILVGGGWQTWAPTIAWTSGGGQPSAPDVVVARYIVVNNTVTYVITFYGTNDSGAQLTAMTVTLPFTPKDVNAYVDAGGHNSVNSKVTPSGAVYSYVDATDGTPANRKILVPGFTLAIAADYIFNFAGHYEITGK